jgi:hypothetical protein
MNILTREIRRVYNLSLDTSSSFREKQPFRAARTEAKCLPLLTVLTALLTSTLVKEKVAATTAGTGVKEKKISR